MILAGVSDTASAATAIAFSINMIVFIPILGLTIAVTTLVGQQIGQGNAQLASRATWTSLWVGLAYSALFAVLYFLVPEIFLLAHGGTDDFDTVRDMTIVLLWFVAVYCLFDTVQLVFVSAIKGAGDTFFVVMNTLLTSVVFVATGWCGSRFFETVNGQVYWWWTCLTGWIVLLSMVYFLRFQQGKWRKMKVIEADLIETAETAV